MLLLFISLLFKNHFIWSRLNWPNVQIHSIAVVMGIIINIINNKNNNMGNINSNNGIRKASVQILWLVLLSPSDYVFARKLGLK